MLVQQQSGDASETVLEVLAVGIGNARSRDAAGVDGFEDGEFSVVRGAAERVQDHPIDPAKDCGGGGNTERQGKHCDRCPSRGSTEDTRCVTEVFEDAAHRVRGFEGNWASYFKCLILFNTAGESIIISGAGCPKVDASAPAPVVDRNLHPYSMQAFLNAIHLDGLPSRTSGPKTAVREASAEVAVDTRPT